MAVLTQARSEGLRDEGVSRSPAPGPPPSAPVTIYNVAPRLAAPHGRSRCGGGARTIIVIDDGPCSSITSRRESTSTRGMARLGGRTGILPRSVWSRAWAEESEKELV